MIRASIAAVAAAAALVGCGDRGDRRGDTNRAEEKTAEVRPTTVTETGCLTARGDRFVLTDLERGAGEATTETFQLTGSEEQLRPHVGKQVRVNGEAEAPKVAVVQESTPAPAEPRAEGTAGGAEPKVRTQAETRMEVRTLKVSTVEPTGASCAAETKGGSATPER